MSIDNVKLSFGRCILKKDFFDRFYEIFVESHSSFKDLFANTDMEKQKALLRGSINSSIMFAQGSAFAKNELDKVAIVHDQNHKNIKPEYYPYWIDSLVTTVKEFDKNMTPQLEQEWRQCLKSAVDVFIEHYKKES